MPMEEPHKLLVYPWVDKELTFEWLVIQVGEGLSERAEKRRAQGNPQIPIISCCIWAVYLVFSCVISFCVPHCLVNVDDWMQRQNK